MLMGVAWPAAGRKVGAVFCARMRPMQLFLIRHGEAVDADATTPDGSRWLTARGRAETAAAATWLRTSPPAVFVTSPLVRAAQTAELLAHELLPHDPVTVLGALATGDVSAIVRAVSEHRGPSPLALVGHEPTLSQVASTLLATTRWPGFEKSAVATFTLDAGTWSFVGMFLPRSGRTLGRLPR